MRRSPGQDFSDNKKPRFGGSQDGPPARGGYPQRGGYDSRGPQRPFRAEGGERRGNGDEGFNGRRPFQARDDRGGQSDRGSQGGFDRQNGRSFSPRSTFRREEGAQGGYGTPARPQNNEAARPSFNAGPAPRPAAAATPRPVPAARLKEGVAQANRALAEVIEQFGSTLSGDYDISALEVMVSFSEDGRFLGFGQGGAATMTLSVTPLSAEDILEGEEADLMDMDADDDDSEDLEFVDETSMALLADDDQDVVAASDDVADEDVAEEAVTAEAEAEAPKAKKSPRKKAAKSKAKTQDVPSEH